MSFNYFQVSTSTYGCNKHDDDFSCFDETSSIHKITLVELNDLDVHDLDLFKNKTQILMSRL